MNNHITKWKNAWRTTWYYIWFSILLNIFLCPIHIGKIDLIDNNSVAKIIFYTGMILVYFPFAVLWASKASGLHPLTKKEATEKEKREREEFEEINKSNNTSNKNLNLIENSADFSES